MSLAIAVGVLIPFGARAHVYSTVSSQYLFRPTAIEVLPVCFSVFGFSASEFSRLSQLVVDTDQGNVQYRCG
jgi:hypothetical protein